MLDVAQRLLGVIERVRGSLLEAIAGPYGQLLGLDDVASGQRVVLAHEHMHARVEQRVERHIGVIEGLLHDALVESI